MNIFTFIKKMYARSFNLIPQNYGFYLASRQKPISNQTIKQMFGRFSEINRKPIGTCKGFDQRKQKVTSKSLSKK